MYMEIDTTNFANIGAILTESQTEVMRLETATVATICSILYQSPVIVLSTPTLGKSMIHLFSGGYVVVPHNFLQKVLKRFTIVKQVVEIVNEGVNPWGKR